MFSVVMLLVLTAGCGKNKGSKDRIVEVDDNDRNIAVLTERTPQESDSIWRVSPTTSIRRFLAKRTHYEKTTSPESIYYAYIDLRSAGYPLVVVECSREGQVRRTQVHDREGWELANALEGVSWLGGSRIFVDTHVNPSLGFGLEIDLQTQKMDVYAGCLFTWDRDGRRVAYFREPPHFGTPPEIPSTLMVGHTEICKVPSRVPSDLYWHPTDNKLLAFIPPEDGKAGQVVVVDFSSGSKPSVKRFRVQPQDR
jgi:hypothetical protein